MNASMKAMGLVTEAEKEQLEFRVNNSKILVKGLTSLLEGATDTEDRDRVQELLDVTNKSIATSQAHIRLMSLMSRLTNGIY